MSPEYASAGAMSSEKKSLKRKKKADGECEFAAGQRVWFVGPPQQLSATDRVEHGLEGEVVAASVFDAHEASGELVVTGTQRRVSVKFQGNAECVECFLTELSRSWPPRPLAGGCYTLGQQVYFRGVQQRLLSGDRVDYSHPGEVVGASSIDPATRVAIRFRGNENATDCHLDTLSASPPASDESPLLTGITAGRDTPPLGAARLDSPDDDDGSDGGSDAEGQTPRARARRVRGAGADGEWDMT